MEHLKAKSLPAACLASYFVGLSRLKTVRQAGRPVYHGSDHYRGEHADSGFYRGQLPADNSLTLAKCFLKSYFLRYINQAIIKIGYSSCLH
jgi:hypothetical protein